MYASAKRLYRDKNLTEAVKSYNIAAVEFGHKEDPIRVAELYLDGRGVPKNEAEALRLFSGYLLTKVFKTPKII